MSQQKHNKVLIVDSDEQVLIVLERLLEDEGIETATTWSARQALDLIKGNGFDILVTGDHLPDLSCEELLREIQGEELPASVLVMESSGVKTASSAEYFASLGAAVTLRRREYVKLLSCVKAMLENRAGKQARAA